MTERYRHGSRSALQPVVAGLVTAVVAFSSSFAVVVEGLEAVGATTGQAASGLMVLSIVMGLGCILFAVRYRVPVTLAWSTPGAALLVSALVPSGGFASACGAFVVAGGLVLVTGLLRPVASLVQRIPRQVASGMLAGVLLPLCLQPFTQVAHSPLHIAPIIGVWILLTLLAPRWAVPGAFCAALLVMVMSGALAGFSPSAAQPQLVFVAPTFEWQSIVALALPLYIVTMTGQNVPGAAVMSSLQYEVPFGKVMVGTGLGSVVAATFGGHAVNLSAIAAALVAGPDAGPDRSRRWIAAVTTGLGYILLGLSASALVVLSHASAAGILAAVAGLALIGSFSAATATALSGSEHQLAAAMTFLVCASGTTVAGIGSPFWGLLTGGAVYWLPSALPQLRRRLRWTPASRVG